ncbi:cucumisin-like [Quillaja saponaria]|uniref:Cucumisin-like n=1 Tax=Quillaja saponaria TaxID=32244 RepID=A0AAD7PMH3_QUISA|nr:cucumisin-like [Quillaja saponaria]
MLETVLGSTEAAKESLIYSYGRSFNGFAAMLSGEEVDKCSDMEGVISVIPNIALKLYTTRSWDDIRLTESYVRRSSSRGGNVIIGMFDTGIWPESDSFNDEGLEPPPRKWKGKCQQAPENFTCNNKIIGTRYYNLLGIGDGSQGDTTGHGTITASIAAGREVQGASYYGLTKGVARGGAPSARLAVYKVCWPNFGCYAANILAAFDDAIADGVDIISISFGDYINQDYFKDTIGLGSFHAMRKGILTIAGAGNSGPSRALLCNSAPWMVTVAASSVDRKFISRLVLGNGEAIVYTRWRFVLYLKSFNLMNAASVMDPKKDENENEFAYGSGLINPVKAVDPGLVFNASEADYIDFLCKQGYSKTNSPRTITNDSSVCKSTNYGRAWDLNYPSFSLAIEDGHKIEGKFIRTVTNVGSPNSTYVAISNMPKYIKVDVNPSVLAFSAIGEEKSFTVKVSGPPIIQVPIISGSITWKHEKHEVRTPLVVYTVLPAALKEKIF